MCKALPANYKYNFGPVIFFSTYFEQNQIMKIA